jgi:hypothetical protein
VQAALATLAELTELAVRVEPGNAPVVTAHASNSFDFTFDALLHHGLATDPANQKCQVRSSAAERGEAGVAVDQIVDVRLRGLRRSALWHNP